MKSVAAVLLILIALPAAAEDPRAKTSAVITAPTGAAERTSARVGVPSPPPPDLSTHQAEVPTTADPRARDSVGAAEFKALQAREIASGRARLVSPSGERTVRPGDTVEGAVIRTIEPGRIVLSRPSAGGADDLIVLLFDSAGHARVRVYATTHPHAAPSGR